jgi:hypothetical protein
MQFFSPGAGGSSGSGAGEGQGGAGAGSSGEGQAGEGQSPSRREGEASQVGTLPDDPAELKKLLATEQAERKRLAEVHEEMKGKFTKRELEEEAARQDNLKKQGEFQKLLEEQTPKFQAATQAVKRYEEVLNKYLEAELKAIPENLKALMPDGDPASKLEWIAKAKDAGAVKPAQPPARKPGDGSPPPGGSSAGTMTRAAFDALTPTERRDASKAGVKLVD